MYIKQKHSNDCYKTTIANLLNIDYDTIPDFHEYFDPPINTPKIVAKVDNFLDSIGCYRFLLGVTVTNGRAEIPFYCSLKRFKCIGILEDPIGKNSHSVLLEVQVYNTFDCAVTLVHDPSKENKYVVEDLTQIEIIFKKGNL